MTNLSRAASLGVGGLEHLGPRVRDVLARYIDGSLSAEMALMYWLQITPQLKEIQTALIAALQASRSHGAPSHQVDELTRLSALAAANEGSCERIAVMLRSGVDTDEPAATIAEGIAFAKRLFDWSVEQCPEASVALYSLGNPAILDAATAEIVALMRRWGLLGVARDALEIGCGIGRFATDLSVEVNTYTGIDVSPRMIEAARLRCAGLANVDLRECTGRDLAMFEPASFDLVYSVDCFPYLFQAGWPLVEKHFSEAARVLRPGGDFLMLELSYHRSLDEDRRDVTALAGTTLDVLINGARPLKLWDGAAFHLRRR
jgi:SAM-dependent methyltransferase